MTTDIEFMKVALQLAKKGQGKTSPNPCVGAVVVSDGQIVGKGYHEKAGMPHAEVNAIADAGELTRGATIYVTLEPCNHTGRTPPCTQAILNAGISKVVVGMLDPNPLVQGGGCRFLEENGVDVTSGVLDHECQAINYPFIKHITKGLPWTVMKAGMSLDAKITYIKGQGGKITGAKSATVTHQLRNSCDAILIGVETALIDNPSLTTRLEDEQTQDPIRIILDTNLRLSPVSNLLQQKSDAPTWIFCGQEASEENEQVLKDAGAVIYRVPYNKNMIDLSAVLAKLGALNVTSVLIEGGAKIHATMLQQNLIDEVYLFTAPFFIGDNGTPLLSGYEPENSGLPHIRQIETQQLGEDTLIHGFLSDLPFS